MSTEKRFESDSRNRINKGDNNEDDYDASFEMNSFDELEELKVDNNILRGIYGYGFEKPSPIQRKSIKPLISGRDTIAQAQSGTGKTAAFSVGILSKIDLTENNYLLKQQRF